jgi:IrrE N-terminal-like domain
MATTWEKLAGDTSKFAIRVSFSDDPDAGVGAAIEDSASWGGFQLWAGGQNLCAHLAADERAESVHWYLLPLLEWFTNNWDAIFHEERLPNRNAAPTAQAALERTADAPLSVTEEISEYWDLRWFEWWERHCVEAARDGGVFPRVYLRRWRDQFELSWTGSNESPDQPVQFISSTSYCRVSLEEAAAALHDVLRDAVDQLCSRVPASERLGTLRARLAKLGTVRTEPWAWMLGLGSTLDEMQSSWRRLRIVLRRFPKSARQVILGSGQGRGLVFQPFPAALMFGAVSPQLEDADRVRLLEELARAIGEEPGGLLQDLTRPAPLDSRRAWDQGYELAQECLEQMGLDVDAPSAVDMDALIEQCRISVRSISLADESVRAVAIGGPTYTPTILLNETHEAIRFTSGLRFSLAHELCHLIYDRSHAKEVTLPSGEWAPRDIEQRANAFAAMLLMPPRRVASAILESPQSAWRDWPAIVSQCLQTGLIAATHHLANLGVLTEEQRDALIERGAVEASVSR